MALLMDNKNSKNNPSEVEIVGGVIEVTGSPDGGRLISGLWRIFTTSYQVQKGDFLMDRSRSLLQRHLKRMQLDDQNVIQETYEDVKGMREGIEKKRGASSQFLRNLEARKYRRHAEMMYEIVQTASARALDNQLLNQIAEAIRPPAPGGGSGTSRLTDTVASNPFSDSHAVSGITDININNLDQVGMSSIHDEATNEEAAVFDLYGRDQSVKRIIAFSGDRKDTAPLSIASAPVASSSQQEDDSRPDIIAASIPDVPDQRVDEQGETRTLDSFALSEVAASEGKRPHPVARASVHPVDGDPYTRSTASRRRCK